MSTFDYLTFVLVIFNLVQSDSKSCLYGWHLSDDETTCSAKCFTSQLYFSNVYCTFFALKSATLSYNWSTNTLSMPSGDSFGSKTSLIIPSCHNVTLNKDQYDVTPDGFIQIAPHLMEIPLESALFNVASSNVTLCYPSSPQLLQCDLTSARPGSYKIVNEVILTVPERNLTAFLGDFYVNDEAIAFFCARSSPNVSFSKYPRCNMVVLQHTDYLINEDSSMTVLRANVTIKNPLYAINFTQRAIVCFPLSFEYLNCPLKTTVPEFFYTISPNLTLLDPSYRSSFGPFDYYITVDSQWTTCVIRLPEHFAQVLLTEACAYSYLVSTFALSLTIVSKFKTLTQNYHGYCLLWHLVSLDVMYFGLGAKLFCDKTGLVSCYSLFVVYYFFNMAAFFWLNVIAYDSYRFFSKIKTVRHFGPECDGCWPYVTLPDNSVVRFVVYSACSWGLAAILTVVVLVLDLYVSPFDFRYPVRPFVLPSCWFINTQAIVWFFIVPMAVITVNNLIFFGLTIRILHRASEGTQVVNIRRRKQVLRISMKLFILMGFCYMVDCVCFSVCIYYHTLFQSWYWFASSILTSLQGLIISIIYCSPNRVLKNIRSLCQNKTYDTKL